jgi:predicted kinase
LGVLVAISGLSGTGKSTVGEAVARRHRAIWLSVDEVEDALLGVGLVSDSTAGVAAYEAVAAAPDLTVAEARERLDADGERFVYFRDRATGRGSVLYHRVDGQLGLLTPAA